MEGCVDMDEDLFEALRVMHRHAAIEMRAEHAQVMCVACEVVHPYTQKALSMMHRHAAIEMKAEHAQVMCSCMHFFTRIHRKCWCE
jgi:hypothetical protein